MNKKTTNLIVILLIVIIVIAVGINYSKDKSSSDDMKMGDTQMTQEVKEAVTKFKETLVTKHQYIDGEHIFIGEFEVPNPCYNYTINVKDEGDEKIIDIVYVEPELETCPVETPAKKKMLATFVAPEDQKVGAMVNGEGVNLNIVEVPAGEDITQY